MHKIAFNDALSMYIFDIPWYLVSASRCLPMVSDELDNGYSRMAWYAHDSDWALSAMISSS